MQINLSELFVREGKEKTYTPDIEMTAFHGPEGIYEIASKEPVKLRLQNIGDRKLYMEGDTKLSLYIPCDRCLAESRRAYDRAFVHGLARTLFDEENDDYIVVEDGILDLDGLVMEDITLEMPMQMLCKEDCKGLCPQCGADLNKGDCGCKKPGDPRFDVLNDLLKS